MAKGAPRHGAAPDPDDIMARYTEVADRLAELLPEARAAVKDLAGAVKDARRLADKIRGDVEAAAHAAGQAELERYSGHLTEAMNVHAEAMNAAIDRARTAVIQALVPADVVVTDAGLEVAWLSGKFAMQEVPGVEVLDPPPPPITGPDDELAAAMIRAEANDGRERGYVDPAETVKMIRELSGIADAAGMDPPARARIRGLASAFRRRGREDLALAVESLAHPTAYRRNP